jgi:hypothetical protein
VDRQLPKAALAVWTPAAIRQLNEGRPETKGMMRVSKLEILGSFRYDGWTILYVGTYVSDEVFMFYRGDPASSDYLTIWGGAAGRDETSDIVKWETQYAPGIPAPLAACFAWHVTRDPAY